MALFAEHVVETSRAACELRGLQAELRQTLLDKSAQAASLADAGQVALHVRHEAGNACLAEGFGQYLKGNGFTGTGGTGDESVAVRHLADNGNRSVRTMGDIESVRCVVHSGM